MSSATRSLLARTLVIATVAVFAIVVGIPATVGSLRTPGVVAAASGDPTHGITVQGTAIVSLKPDLATVSLGVQAQASTASAAQSGANKAMAAVIAAVKGQGVADADLATQGIDLNPTYGDQTVSGTPRVTGYQASESLSVKVRDIDKVGPVLDAGVNAGATSVGGISFSLADPTAATAQARQMAVKDAHDRAQALATAAGVTLGAPISITEESATQPPIYYATGAAVAPDKSYVATPVQTGTTDVTVTVDIVYSIP
ncbi:MAG TPA: SIMPL domain-containing protein [Candidatus Sulfotelmatobacter sp.]|nr:SIMPL domain-containing protein [Candidatus Sulfotelmatobacter sp.]